MLKLLKYEMIHEWRSYGIIYMIFLAVCILCPILFRDQFFATRSAMDSNTMADFLGMIAIMAIMIMSMAIVVSTAINLALNYRNSMFKRPGYLTLTLPVSTHQLILSKVLADILWIVVASFVLF